MAAAVVLLLPHRPRLPDPTTGPTHGDSAPGWMLRLRVLWCGLAAIAGAAFVGGSLGPAAGLAAAVATWVTIGRAEPALVRREREAVRRDLPHVVTLFASSLRGGAAPGEAVAVVCAALPGAAADRLQGVGARLALGSDPVRVWESLAADRELAPLGRTMARAQTTGAPVTRAVERLADELARTARADVEERARAVGVKAALPLGLCLLPAFLLLGIAPLVAGLMSSLDL
jgi:Flp pilus assembly protein TadB